MSLWWLVLGLLLLLPFALWLDHRQRRRWMCSACGEPCWTEPAFLAHRAKCGKVRVVAIPTPPSASPRS